MPLEIINDRWTAHDLEDVFLVNRTKFTATRKEFLKKILYNNIAIIAIQHSKTYFVDTFGDFSHTVE